MLKEDLVKEVAKVAGLKQKDAHKFVNAFISVVETAMENGEYITISGFGKFYVHNAKEREARNPQTGEKVIVPARNVVKFKVAKQLSDMVK